MYCSANSKQIGHLFYATVLRPIFTHIIHIVYMHSKMLLAVYFQVVKIWRYLNKFNHTLFCLYFAGCYNCARYIAKIRIKQGPTIPHEGNRPLVRNGPVTMLWWYLPFAAKQRLRAGVSHNWLLPTEWRTCYLGDNIGLLRCQYEQRASCCFLCHKSCHFVHIVANFTICCIEYFCDGLIT